MLHFCRETFYAVSLPNEILNRWYEWIDIFFILTMYNEVENVELHFKPLHLYPFFISILSLYSLVFTFFS